MCALPTWSYRPVCPSGPDRSKTGTWSPPATGRTCYECVTRVTGLSRVTFHVPVPHLGHLAGVEEVCPLQGDVDLVQAGEVAVPDQSEISIVTW